jgi:hypothetical protein
MARDPKTGDLTADSGTPPNQSQQSNQPGQQAQAGQHNEQQVRQQLAAAGCPDEGAQVVSEAVRAGFSPVDMLAWLMENSPQIVNLLRQLLGQRAAARAPGQQSKPPA